MNINTIGYDLEYNLWLVARLFFEADEPLECTSRARYQDDAVTVEITASFEGRTIRASHSHSCPQDAGSHLKNRITSAAAGMAFCKAAQQLRPRSLPWGVMTGIRPAKPVRRMLLEGKSDAQIINYLKELYGVTAPKAALALEVAKNELPIIAANRPDEIGLYIGIPFCPTRCLYCSFVSSDLRHTKKYLGDYCALLEKEIAYSAELLRREGLRASSLYIGGGTPTSLPEDKLGALMDAIHAHLDLSNLREFSVEAGRPDTITEEKLRILSRAGVGRISINPQSMNQKTLETIGRSHTPEQIAEAFDIARRVGFHSINADLIAGLPGETVADFAHTLEQIGALAPENITVHTMSVKRGSDLNQYRDSYALSAAQTVEAMLDLSRRFMAGAGLVPYYMYRQKNMLGNLENVGYALPGHLSEYNINIMEEVQTILALGGGGVSKVILPARDRIERVFNFKTPIDYIARFDEILARKDAFISLARIAQNETGAFDIN